MPLSSPPPLVVLLSPVLSGCLTTIDLGLLDGGMGVGGHDAGASCPVEMVRVPLEPPLCIDRREVTNADYARFLRAPGGAQPSFCRWNDQLEPDNQWPVASSAEQRPVASIDWCDALAYCTSSNKRLCTRSEWLAACSPRRFEVSGSVREWIDECQDGQGGSEGNDPCLFLGGAGVAGDASALACTMSAMTDRRSRTSADRGFRCCTD